MIQVERCDRAEEWDDYVENNDGHPLQLWGWGELKAAHRWQVERVFVYKGKDRMGAAQLQIRKLPKPFNCLVYISRGPIAAEADRAEVLRALENYAKTKHRAVSLSVEPDWETFPDMLGWIKAKNTVLISQTLRLDLKKSDDELLSAMAKKTRQYIRKSSQEQLDIRQVRDMEDLTLCMEIYKQTAARAGFGIHSDDYYTHLRRELQNHSVVMAAYHDNRPVAFLWLVASPHIAFELYGGVNEVGQSLRANYALKWAAIKHCKEQGIDVYDLNGLLNDGISNFKRGFSDHEDQLAGTYDRPLSPLYQVWVHGLPLAKKIVQKIKS